MATRAIAAEVTEAGAVTTFLICAQDAAVRLTLAPNGELVSDCEHEAPISGVCTAGTEGSRGLRQPITDRSLATERVAPVAALTLPTLVDSSGNSVGPVSREIIWDSADKRSLRIDGVDTVDAEFTCSICVRQPTNKSPHLSPAWLGPT